MNLVTLIGYNLGLLSLQCILTTKASAMKIIVMLQRRGISLYLAGKTTLKFCVWNWDFLSEN